MSLNDLYNGIDIKEYKIKLIQSLHTVLNLLNG